MEFVLYRAKVRFGTMPLFLDRVSPQVLLAQAIRSKPSFEISSRQIWHIGNVEVVGPAQLYFMVGRDTQRTMAAYINGDFIEQEAPVCPYTPVAVDADYQVVAIAQNRDVSANTDTIAKRIAQCLSNSSKAREQGATIELSEIPDPYEFISYLQEAESITKFWYSLSRPNPADDDEDYYQPFQRVIDKTRADRGRVALNGHHLDTDTCERIARSAAATGGDAGATLSLPGERPLPRRLKGNKATTPTDVAPETVEQKMGLIMRIRQKYFDIRGRLDET